MKSTTLKIPKIDLKKLNTSSKTNEQSTHFQTARTPMNCLSYTFRACKEKAKKSKYETNSYLFDLKNTLTLNLQMISTMLTSMSKPIRNLDKKINAITALTSKVDRLNKEKETLRMKILVDSQIKEEAKRRKDENIGMYAEESDELSESVKKKKTTIKRLQKKFNEVEIYVQRECQKIPKYKKMFIDYEIVPFLTDNEDLLSKKNELYTQIKMLDTEVNLVLKENIELKKREEFITTEDLDSARNNGSTKYSELVKSYTVKNKYLLKYKNNLSEMLNAMNTKVRASNVKNNLMKFIENDNNDNTMNKSVSYCDIVVDTANSRKPNNINNNIWDISCIEKVNDDN